MTKEDRYIVIIGLLLIPLIFLIFLFTNGRIKESEVQDAQTIDVVRHYDGEDLYSLSIPTGNRSACIWTYYAGSGHIPDMKYSYAETSSEKNTLYFYGDEYDWKVRCVDDWGNLYIGKFPTE